MLFFMQPNIYQLGQDLSPVTWENKKIMEKLVLAMSVYLELYQIETQYQNRDRKVNLLDTAGH